MVRSPPRRKVTTISGAASGSAHVANGDQSVEPTTHHAWSSKRGLSRKARPSASKLTSIVGDSSQPHERLSVATAAAAPNRSPLLVAEQEIVARPSTSA